MRQEQIIDSASLLVEDETLTADGESRRFDFGSGGIPEGTTVVLALSDVSLAGAGCAIVLNAYRDGLRWIIGDWGVGSHKGPIRIVLPEDLDANGLSLSWELSGTMPSVTLTAWLEPRPVEIVEPQMEIRHAGAW